MYNLFISTPFQAYRHNLELLKTFDASNFPFKEYIIDINKQIACVNYQTFNKSEMLMKPLKKITENEIDSWQQTYKGCDKAYIDENDFIREQLKKIAKEYYKFSPYLVNKISSFGLNESQYKAFEAALSQSFTIIQGPPGRFNFMVLLLKVKISFLFHFLNRNWKNTCWTTDCPSSPTESIFKNPPNMPHQSCSGSIPTRDSTVLSSCYTYRR